MKRIKLRQDKHVLVDDEDFEWLNQWKWYYTGSYAARWKNYKRIYMHRLINETPIGLETDHINQDKLDNRRTNLRTVTRSQNIRNRPSPIQGTSGAIGVSWAKSKNKWRAYVTINYKQIHLGHFLELEDAKKARIEGEKRYGL